MYTSRKTSDILFECNTCGKTFIKYCSLKLHRKWKHENIEINRECLKCDKTFNDSSALKRHLLAIHNGDPDADPRPHGSILWNGHEDLQTFKFYSYKDFCEWKSKTERESVAKFVRQRGSRVRKDGSSVTIYNCHRDGYFHPKGKFIRRNRLMGTNKINSHCPSHMRVIQKNNVFSVAYLPTHSGHSVDLSKISITRKDDDRTAKLLEKNVPLDDILDKVRNSLVGSRIISKKSLPSIIDKFVLAADVISDVPEESCINDWVVKYQNQENFIQFYKPQGVILESHPQLALRDLCLIIANSRQLEFLQKYGNNCICVDIVGTAFENVYMFPIVVINDQNKGIPCCFMFSNLKSSTILEIYFKTLKSLISCDLKPKYFMSGFGDNLFNSWKAVYPKSQCKLLYSSWKIDHEWRNILKTVPHKAKQVEVYRLIKTLEFDDNIFSFNAVADHLRNELSKDEETEKFVQKFLKYLENPELWALCHRLDIDSDFGTALENVHIILKNISLKKIFSKSLDNLITTLLRFNCLEYYDTYLDAETDELQKKILEIKDSHDDSVSMGSVYLEEITKYRWSVKATLSNDLTSYCVMKRKETCDCNIICPECSVCVHIFVCTCMDFVVSWKMCKHIHLVSCWLKCFVEMPGEAVLESEAILKEPHQLMCLEVDSDDLQDVMGEEIEIQATLDEIKEEQMDEEVFILENKQSEELENEQGEGLVDKHVEELDNEPDQSLQYDHQGVELEKENCKMLINEQSEEVISEESDDMFEEYIKDEPVQYTLVVHDPAVTEEMVAAEEVASKAPLEVNGDTNNCNLQAKKRNLLTTMTNMVDLIESEEQLEAVSKHISVLDEILRTSGTNQPIETENSCDLSNSFFSNQVVQTVILTPDQESILKSDVEVPIEFIKYQVVQLDT